MRIIHIEPLQDSSLFIHCCRKGPPSCDRHWQDISMKIIRLIIHTDQKKMEMSAFATRMHSSRMRTTRSLTVSPYLVVSHTCPPEQPRTLPPRATTHAPWSNHAWLLEQPCTPPEQPHMPPRATTHAPRSNHAHLLEQPYMPPPEQSHTPPEQPHMAPPRATTHAPQEQPCMPPCEQNDKLV